MNLMKSNEFKVGLLVFVVSGIVAFMTLRVSEDPSYWGGSMRLHFKINDASGLVKMSAVKMAGITIGVIRDITLQDGMANVDLSVRGDVPYTTNSAVELRSLGILGDKYVEIVLGDGQGTRLADGDEIPNVRVSGSMDEVMGGVGEATTSFTNITRNLEKATTGDGDIDSPVGRILRNLETITNSMAQVSNKQEQRMNEIVENLHTVSVVLEDMMNDEDGPDLKEAMDNAINSLSRIESSLGHLDDAAEKINKGNGTIGKLINDDETIEKLNETVDGVNNLIGTANRLETVLDFHSEYLANVSEAKNYLAIQLKPGLDRYYEFGVVDDPLGVSETIDTTTTSGATTTTSSETKVFRNKVKFSAIFAKNFYDFTIKGGLMESSGGLGLDYHLFKKRLRLSVEAFDFAATQVHLRGIVKYKFMKGMYVVGGADDILSNQGRFSSFIGAGLFLTNDDLKTIMSALSF